MRFIAARICGGCAHPTHTGETCSCGVFHILLSLSSGTDASGEVKRTPSAAAATGIWSVPKPDTTVYTTGPSRGSSSLALRRPAAGGCEAAVGGWSGGGGGGGGRPQGPSSVTLAICTCERPTGSPWARPCLRARSCAGVGGDRGPSVDPSSWMPARGKQHTQHAQR